MPQSDVVSLPARPGAAHSLADIERLAEAVARSGMFGIRTKEQAMVLMAISQAEGRHPALAARDYDIIGNRPAKKAEAMMRDMLEAGGKIEWHALTDEIADATFSHPVGGTIRITWDQARVKRAGLTGQTGHQKYPRAMLRSRCVSEGVRTVCPMATSGMYVPEEVRDITNTKITTPSLANQVAALSSDTTGDLDDFAADPVKEPVTEEVKEPVTELHLRSTAAPLLPRSPLWQEDSYLHEPSLLFESEQPDWRKWRDDMVFFVGDAISGDELDKLYNDNQKLLNRLRRTNGDLYREIIDAFNARHGELNAQAAS